MAGLVRSLLGWGNPRIPYDPHETDPSLLSENTTFEDFTTEKFTYRNIRVFYREHPHAEDLPNIPLLVFIHGLGGSVAQFEPLITHFVKRASCLAIDFPGCGRSEFSPKDWDAYSTESLVHLVETVISQYRQDDQGIVLFGHSYGSALAAKLAHRTSPHAIPDVQRNVLGLVALCPPAGPPKEQAVALYKRLLWIPTPVFDLWRAWDGRGGSESASVRRFVGPEADEPARKLQYRFNRQSRSPVWRRMAWGILPTFVDGKPHGGMPGQGVWSGLEIPVLAIAGASDHVTPPTEMEKIRAFMTSDSNGMAPEELSEESRTLADSAAPVDTGSIAQRVSDDDDDDAAAAANSGIATRSRHKATQPQVDTVIVDSQSSDEGPATPQGDDQEQIGIPPILAPEKFIRTVLLKAPANHTLPYATRDLNTVAGEIANFLSAKVTDRLNFAWQLRYGSKEGKWDVKNLEKWAKVEPVSKPICGIFRAMKTLREVDELHSPRVFVERWSREIKDVVDISKDKPVYDPQGLQRGGIEYHKFPTVSKIPPTREEVARFLEIVDGIRARQPERQADDPENWAEKYYVGVHCHYGFNRTGFFIVSYLVEREGMSVDEATAAFAEGRPNGIRHPHFLEELALRYGARQV